MKITWDGKKRLENIKKHGFDFEDAREVFMNPMLTAVDDREDYGEERLIGVGFTNGASKSAFDRCSVFGPPNFGFVAATPQLQRIFTESKNRSKESGYFGHFWTPQFTKSRIVVVVFTELESGIRIISCRKALKHERKAYKKEVLDRLGPGGRHAG